MAYDEKIPDFALQPAKSDDSEVNTKKEEDGFDPTPYDRLLVPEAKEQPVSREVPREADKEELKEEFSEEKQEKQEKQESREIGEQEKISPVVFREEAAEEPETKAPSEPLKITPLSGSAIYNELKIAAVSQNLENKIVVEEDILVPDIKPDLISILAMDGKVYLSSKEVQAGQGESGNIRVTGEIPLHTIYIPQKTENRQEISVIQSVLPFKTDWQVNASPMSHFSITPSIEKIEYTVINERKFHAKVTLDLSLKEYADRDFQLFDSLRNEKLELLKENVKISHVAVRKEDSIEIAEDLRLKEGSLRPSKILNSDIRIVENHRQFADEKLVINANIWVTVLYAGEDAEEGEIYEKAAFFQGKTDFTQFILMEKEPDIAASKVSFNDKDLTLAISDDGTEGFHLSGNINTSVEIFRNIEKEVVSDLYHNTKDITYDFSEKKVEAVTGTGNTETTAREIFDIPEKYGPLDKVIYINGNIKEKKNRAEDGKVTVEGILEGQILCVPEEEGKKCFTIKKELPFRGSMDIPSAKEPVKIESSAVIKELWFDKINSKQVEVNASLQIESTAIEEKNIKIIKNPCFVENSQSKRPSAMVIYIARKGDSLWNIAKKYKTGIDTIKSINQMEENQDVAEGMRLLIVK